MGNELNFEAHDESLKNILFSTLKFRVPRYQRPYSWGEDQLTEFWNDLITSEEPYFFGSLIFNNEPLKETGFAEVIDGQQRMLTATILIAALRNLAEGIDGRIADLFQRQDIAIEDRTGKESYRIECGDSARPFFQDYIQSRNGDILGAVPTTPEEALIKTNYEFLHKKVETEMRRFDTNEDKLSYIQRLRDKVSDLVVIRIEINNEEDAYEIFETTNARGVDLSIADLLKNLIFKKIKAQDDRDIAKEIWSEIVNNVQETGTELKRFLRYFWISKYSFVTEKHIFREIKRYITDWQVLLEELWSASEWYNKLIEGRREDWLELKHGQKIFKSVSALKLMGVSQCYVLLLSILRNYLQLGTNPMRIFELIENFTFNYSAICKLPSNKVEKIFSKYARAIENTVKTEQEKRIAGRVQSLFSELEKELKDERPSLELFKERFADVSYSQSQRSRDLVKYILNEINTLDQTGEQKIDFDNVNIEHVLPQTPSKEWNLTKREIKGYVNKLGNLTLVSKIFNSQIGNRIISEKIDSYPGSEIAMTQYLVKRLKDLEYTWGDAQIYQRQQEFAELAYHEVWDF